ncbi:MAG: malectin [Acidobacteriaceae bacterium]|nr:malectin [Acidobacteriaceae bacterium]
MRNLLTLIVTIVAIGCLPGTRAALKKENVVVAINCGSSFPFSTPSGVVYAADKYFKNGVVSSAGKAYTDVWPELSQIDLYKTERYADAEFLSYELPLKKEAEDGHYVLVLKFSEVYFEKAGGKVFDVALGSKMVVEDLDIFARAGKFSPHDEFVEFDVKNKAVYHKGELAKDAYVAGKLAVRFVKGPADNPKINAILLVKGGLDGKSHMTTKRG